jgi:hypothetical protein
MSLCPNHRQITEQINAKLPKKLAPNYRILRNYIIFDIFYNYVFMSKDYLDLMDYFDLMSLCPNTASA